MISRAQALAGNSAYSRIASALEAIGVAPSQMHIGRYGALYEVRFFVLPDTHIRLKIAGSFTTSDYQAIFNNHVKHSQRASASSE